MMDRIKNATDVMNMMDEWSDDSTTVTFGSEDSDTFGGDTEFDITTLDGFLAELERREALRSPLNRILGYVVLVFFLIIWIWTTVLAFQDKVVHGIFSLITCCCCGIYAFIWVAFIYKGEQKGILVALWLICLLLNITRLFL